MGRRDSTHGLRENRDNEGEGVRTAKEGDKMKM